MDKEWDNLFLLKALKNGIKKIISFSSWTNDQV